MLIETALTLLLAAASVIAARSIGVNSLLLQLPIGLVLLIAVRLLTYTPLAMLGAAAIANFTYYVVLLAIVTFGILRFKKQLGIKAFALPLLISIVSIAQVWLLGIFPPKHGDSLYILAMAEKLSSGASPAGFNNSNAIKRGFAYPAMLSISEPGTYFAAFTFFNFACLLLLAYWLVTSLTKNLNQKHVKLIFGAVALAVFTSAMGLRLMVYINGHLMFALAILGAVTVILSARQQGQISRAMLLIVFSCQLVLTTSRPEGVAFAVLIVLPLLEQQLLKPLVRSALITLPLVSFVAWLVMFDSYLLDSIPFGALAILALAAIAGFSVSIAMVAKLLKHATNLAIAAFALLLIAVTIFAPAQMAAGFAAQAINLFGFGGDWGFSFWALAIIIAISAKSISQVAELRLMLKLCLLFAIASVSSKLADAGQSGTISIGRVAWQDSLNRMWIHFVVLLFVIAAVALANQIEGAKRVAEIKF